MSGRLDGKTAVVTGGAGGIGSAIAALFLAEGASVFVLDLDEQQGIQVARTLGKGDRPVQFIRADITNDASVSQAAADIRNEAGRIDVLVNCAGGGSARDGLVTDAPLDVFHRTVAVDLLGTVLACRHFIPAIVAGGGGAVVNLSSGASLRGSLTHFYSAAKGGVDSLTRSLAGAFARDNVRVNSVCAGRIMTKRVLEKERSPEKLSRLSTDEVVAKYPFWVGEPRDIASIVLFLASAESRMITGANIPANGGRSAY